MTVWKKLKRRLWVLSQERSTYVGLAMVLGGSTVFGMGESAWLTLLSGLVAMVGLGPAIMVDKKNAYKLQKDAEASSL